MYGLSGNMHVKFKVRIALTVLELSAFDIRCAQTSRRT